MGATTDTNSVRQNVCNAVAQYPYRRWYVTKRRRTIALSGNGTDKRLQTLSSPFRIAASRSWRHHQCMPPDVQREKRFDMLQDNQIKMVLKYMWSKGCQYQIGHFRRWRTGEPQRSHVSMRGVGSVALRGLASRTLTLSSVLSRRMSLAQFLDR